MSGLDKVHYEAVADNTWTLLPAGTYLTVDGHRAADVFAFRRVGHGSYGLLATIFMTTHCDEFYLGDDDHPGEVILVLPEAKEIPK